MITTGKNGLALTLVTPFDVALQKSIEENIGTHIKVFFCGFHN